MQNKPNTFLCNPAVLAESCFLSYILLSVGIIKYIQTAIALTSVSPREMLKTEAVGRGFQHLPRDLANVNVLENNV